jgi:hypothetical protein
MQLEPSLDRVPGHLAAAAALTLIACVPAWADSPKDASTAVPAAVWTAKEARFTFMGFTSHYSCDGLADKMREVLTKLGARKDMQVLALPCSGPLGRPTIFPGVTLKIHVLQPANAQSGSTGGTGDSQTVPAHWQRVRIAPDRDLVREAGDCEVIEQIKQSILPLFSTRNVEYASTCVPHELNIGGTKLSAEVLVADQSAPSRGPGGDHAAPTDTRPSAPGQ